MTSSRFCLYQVQELKNSFRDLQKVVQRFCLTSAIPKKTSKMYSILIAQITLTLVHSYNNITEIPLTSNIPTNISYDMLVDVSKDTPTHISNYMVSDTTKNISANISKDISTDIPSDMRTGSLKDMPIDTSNDLLTNTSEDMTIDISNSTLTGILTDMPTNISRDMKTDISNDSYNILKDKHHSLLTCPFFTLEPGEYQLLSDGTLHIEVYNLTLNEEHYVLMNDRVSFCDPIEEVVTKEYIIKTTHPTLIGLGISMACLLLHLLAFSMVPDLRNLPGWNLAALCFSLFLSYLLFFVINLGEVSEYPDACTATAVLLHFFLLSSILWMSIMSYDVFISLLRATGSLRTSSAQFKWRKFCLYCLLAFGTALLFAVSSLLTDVLDIVPPPYKPAYTKLCWFGKKTPLLIFFAGPVLALTCLNFVFFGLSAYILHFNKMKSAMEEDGESILKRRYLMYFRLSVIMGVTWIVGIIATAANVEWLWYAFVLLNTLQGFFIFLAFTCSKKVKKYFRAKLFKGRWDSQQTLSPTFQSYCFYANSIEKDLDKIVLNSKDKTDTIVIHL